MNRLVAFLFASSLCLLALSRECDAQSVIQLPSFQTFSYSGTVVVPDQGSAFLGGVKRAASSSQRRGPSRAAGSALGNSQASVSATIIDLQEMDRQILGGTPQEFLRRERAKERAIAASQAVPRADQTAATRANQGATRPGKSIAASSQAVDPDAEGKALVRYAREKYRGGDRGTAFDVYQMAIRRLSPQLSELAKQEFRRVFGSAADQALHMASLR